MRLLSSIAVTVSAWVALIGLIVLCIWLGLNSMSNPVGTVFALTGATLGLGWLMQRMDSSY